MPIQMDQVRALADFQSLHKFDFELASPPPGVSSPPSVELNLRCASTDLPKMTITPLDIELHGHHIKRVGKGDTEHQITVTFIETVDLPVLNWINEWHTACWDQNTGVSKATPEVQGTILLRLLDNENQPTMTYRLIGCWLESADPGQPDGASADAMRPTLTISYDRYEAE